jgi:hypothetical protein
MRVQRLFRIFSFIVIFFSFYSPVSIARKSSTGSSSKDSTSRGGHRRESGSHGDRTARPFDIDSFRREFGRMARELGFQSEQPCRPIAGTAQKNYGGFSQPPSYPSGGEGPSSRQPYSNSQEKGSTGSGRRPSGGRYEGSYDWENRRDLHDDRPIDPRGNDHPDIISIRNLNVWTSDQAYGAYCKIYHCDLGSNSELRQDLMRRHHLYYVDVYRKFLLKFFKKEYEDHILELGAKFFYRRERREYRYVPWPEKPERGFR